LSVFGVLFVLGAIFGKAPQPTPVAAPALAAPAPSSTAATTTSSTPTPAAITYTVTAVTDGATIEVTGSNGIRKTVRVLGVVAPATGSGCYSTESLSWANGELAGKAIKLGVETATVSS